MIEMHNIYPLLLVLFFFSLTLILDKIFWHSGFKFSSDNLIYEQINHISNGSGYLGHETQSLVKSASVRTIITPHQYNKYPFLIPPESWQISKAGMRFRHFFHGSGSAEKKFRIQPEIETKKKIYLYFRQVGISFEVITHHFMLEFVDSDLYFINPLLQVGSGPVE